MMLFDQGRVRFCSCAKISRALRFVSICKRGAGNRDFKTAFALQSKGSCMEDWRILLVEDDPELSKLTAEFLEAAGFMVETAKDAPEADRALLRSKPDLIVTDWMLPGEDGLSLCRRIRANSEMPVLILTAKGDEIDRIIGLEVGADDYVTKPFNPRELVARIKAVLRRSCKSAANHRQAATRRLRFAALIADLDAFSLTRDSGLPIQLTAAEFSLLTCFITHPQRVLSRDQLLEWTRGRVSASFDRTIDVQVSRLRKKIEEPHGEPVIKSIRNQGYLFTLPVFEA
jgi:two-component system OmpR family response regulator